MQTEPMTEELLQALGRAVAPGQLSTRLDDRIIYSRDQWPRALLWAMHGEPARHPPDVVAWPADTAGVARVLAVALRHHLPVIPFGGGSGVAGGTVPTLGGLVLDTKRLDRLEEVNEEEGWCQAGAGINGQQLELQLQRHGYTLGHFPSSIYCSCLGGWLAARSAGQMSSLYGKIEDIVLAAEVVLPTGAIVWPSREQSGPGWLQALVGSEGTLGVFTRARLRIQPLPPARLFSAWSFPSVETGLEAIRRIFQAGLHPAVVRLYDPFDTLLAGGVRPPDGGAPRPQLDPELAHHAPWQRRGRLGQLAMGAARIAANRGLRCARPINGLINLVPAQSRLVLVHEGEPELIEAQAAACAEFCRVERGVDLGPGPAEHWYAHRYSVSFKQSKVYDAGVFPDTMEVAATWDRLLPLYRAVRRAMAPHAVVIAHFSHGYAEGCSIYFTFVGPARDEGAEARYLALWEAALSAAAASGATISHHHGVGELKAAHMAAEVGEAGRSLFLALKQVLDPSGGMNPGKLWPRPEPTLAALSATATTIPGDKR